jgi:hypothetical protein
MSPVRGSNPHVRPAVLSTAMDSHTKPTIEEIKEWDEDELLVWITGSNESDRNYSKVTN